MKRCVSYVMAAVLLLATVGVAGAQQQQPNATPDGQDAGYTPFCHQMMMGQGRMMGRGMGPGMMGGGMMGGGMMGPGMMGGGPMMGGDARQQAEMMAMRGEMMKAMGEIMTKYAQRIQPTK